MAVVYLDKDDAISIFSAGTVYGSTGRERVLIHDGARDVKLSSSVEETHFSRNAADYQFRAASGQMEVWLDGVRVAAIPSAGSGAQEARFADGAARISVNPETGAVSLGGRTLTTTPQSHAVILDASRPSTVDPRPNPAPGPDPLPDPEPKPDPEPMSIQKGGNVVTVAAGQTFDASRGAWGIDLSWLDPDLVKIDRDIELTIAGLGIDDTLVFSRQMLGAGLAVDRSASNDSYGTGDAFVPDGRIDIITTTGGQGQLTIHLTGVDPDLERLVTLGTYEGLNRGFHNKHDVATGEGGPATNPDQAFTVQVMGPYGPMNYGVTGFPGITWDSDPTPPEPEGTTKGSNITEALAYGATFDASAGAFGIDLSRLGPSGTDRTITIRGLGTDDTLIFSRAMLDAGLSVDRSVINNSVETGDAFRPDGVIDIVADTGGQGYLTIHLVDVDSALERLVTLGTYEGLNRGFHDKHDVDDASTGPATNPDKLHTVQVMDSYGPTNYGATGFPGIAWLSDPELPEPERTTKGSNITDALAYGAIFDASNGAFGIDLSRLGPSGTDRTITIRGLGTDDTLIFSQAMLDGGLVVDRSVINNSTGFGDAFYPDGHIDIVADTGGQGYLTIRLVDVAINLESLVTLGTYEGLNRGFHDGRDVATGSTGPATNPDKLFTVQVMAPYGPMNYGATGFPGIPWLSDPEPPAPEPGKDDIITRIPAGSNFVMGAPGRNTLFDFSRTTGVLEGVSVVDPDGAGVDWDRLVFTYASRGAGMPREIIDVEEVEATWNGAGDSTFDAGGIGGARLVTVGSARANADIAVMNVRGGTIVAGSNVSFMTVSAGYGVRELDVDGGNAGEIAVQGVEWVTSAVVKSSAANLRLDAYSVDGDLILRTSGNVFMPRINSTASIDITDVRGRLMLDDDGYAVANVVSRGRIMDIDASNLTGELSLHGVNAAVECGGWVNHLGQEMATFIDAADLSGDLTLSNGEFWGTVSGTSRVTLEGGASGTLFTPGSLTIAGDGGGAIRFADNGRAVDRDVVVDASGVTGRMFFHTVSAGGFLNGALTVRGGSGNDEVTVGGVSELEDLAGIRGTTFSNALVFDGGAGEDTLHFDWGVSTRLPKLSLVNVEHVYISDGRITVDALSGVSGMQTQLAGSGVLVVERNGSETLDLSRVSGSGPQGGNIDIVDAGRGGTVRLGGGNVTFHVASKLGGSVTELAGFLLDDTIVFAGMRGDATRIAGTLSGADDAARFADLVARAQADAGWGANRVYCGSAADDSYAVMSDGRDILAVKLAGFNNVFALDRVSFAGE